MQNIKAHGKQKWLIHLSFLCMLFMFTNSYAVMNAFDNPVNHPPIPLLDEQGKHVLESNNPYSPKQSCAGSGCHDYEAITHAYHFEMGRDEADDNYGAKRGLPHLVSPGYYGGYTCMGGDTQNVLAKKVNADAENFADLGSAGWVKDCMSCHTGGGWAEKDREGIRYDEKDIADIKPLDGDYYTREVDHMTGESTVSMWDWKKQARHATSRNSGTPVAVIRSPTQRIGDAPAALRPPQTEHKAAQSWLPQMALRLFGIKF